MASPFLLSGQEVLSWVYLRSLPWLLAYPSPHPPPLSVPHSPTHLSPSSSVFSRLRSITSPTVLANLCGEWGILAGRRNICSGGDKVSARLRPPTETSVPVVSWPPS